MNRKLKYSITALVLFAFSGFLKAQSNFSVEAYMQFREAHKDYSASMILADHPPQTTYYSARQIPADRPDFNRHNVQPSSGCGIETAVVVGRLCNMQGRVYRDHGPRDAG